MSDQRRKDITWNVCEDIRDELKSMNAILHCSNFLEIPQILRSVRASTGRIPPKSKRKA